MICPLELQLKFFELQMRLLLETIYLNRKICFIIRASGELQREL
jgi:hypothetical protein